MASLLECALANLLVAALLALPAGLVGLWGRRPALTHALWALVLVKLITPPFFEFPIPWPTPTVEKSLARAKVDHELEMPPIVHEPLPDIVPAFDEEIVPEEAIVPPIAPDVQPIAALEPPPDIPVPNVTS